MPFDIITFGPLIVEIMRKDVDMDFDVAGEFLGPYASGDTPIFINAAARLGCKTALIGAVGGDDFGKCVTKKLQEAGVDMRYVTKHENLYTGSTFVTYYSDGSRKFMYHLDGSGSVLVDPQGFDKEYFKGCKWVHYTGFTLESSKEYRTAVYRSLEMLDEETKVSFDPNLRGIFTPEEIREMCNPIIKRSNLILPSGEEASLFTGIKTEDEACLKLAEGGKLVVQKKGCQGCRVFDSQNIIEVPAFETVEVDPTGAGDTFAAAFITALIEGKSLYDAGLFANAAGAFSVTEKGPMEGAPSRDVVDRFLESGSKKVK